jgi:hypothetical protein
VSLVHSRTESGLSVMMGGSDERAVARALREHDDALRLVPQGSDALGKIIYKVYRYSGSEQPAEFVLGWWDDYGEPYPLSMALVEMVKQHDKSQRGNAQLISEDEHNRRLRERRQKDYDANVETIQSEELSRKGRIYGFHKSPALAAARRRGRRKGATYDTRYGN